MCRTRTTILNRRIEIPAPDELADGIEVMVDVTTVSERRIGIDESEWRDDAEALADWSVWLSTVEPIEWAT